jgi:mono/diheme cytochrome c family protein
VKKIPDFLYTNASQCSIMESRVMVILQRWSHDKKDISMKQSTLRRYIGTIVAVLFITACGSIMGSTVTQIVPTSTASATTIIGDPETGRAIFNGEKKIEAFVPCSTCHYETRHRFPRLGPDMAGIAERAAKRVPGMSAADYLRDSIRNPDAHIVEDYPASTMNPGYADRLTDQDVDDLVAFLLTL